MGLINKQIVEETQKIKDIDITFLTVPQKKAVTIFVFESNVKKVIYAPCDCKNFPASEIIYDADILIIGNTFIGDVLKNKYNISDIVITHIEEDWGKGLDDYKELEKEYKNITFAYDGMKIEI